MPNWRLIRPYLFYECQQALGDRLRPLWIVLSFLLIVSAVLGMVWQPPAPDPLKPIDSLSDWFWYPIECNAYLRSTVTFDGTSVVNGTAWVVGTEGAILKTEDGGNTWTPRLSGTSAYLHAVTFRADGSTGWIVGAQGTILKTEDGGDNWTSIATSTSKDLHAVTFQADGSTGWVVGTHGTILKTVDEGNNWTSITGQTSNNLHAVAFQANGTGWAVGAEGTILKTTAGSDGWIPVKGGMRQNKSRPTKDLHAVTFQADETVWIVGAGRVILKTIDGGKNWQFTGGASNDLYSVVSVADGTLLAVGEKGTIVKISNGTGIQTQPHPNVNLEGSLQSVAFQANGNTGWIVGGRATILRTTDQGKEWWRLDADGNYGKYPAPWAWGCLAIGIATLGSFALLVSRIPNSDGSTQSGGTQVQVSLNKVFIIHGRDEGTKNTVARFIEQLGLEAVILAEQPSHGLTIIEKFEQHAQVQFAIALLTPDDTGSLQDDENTPNPRARQNVIFELGFFIGRLGRGRVCALTKGDVEIPSDYAGVLYIPLDGSDYWRWKLSQELESAGLNVVKS